MKELKDFEEINEREIGELFIEERLQRFIAHKIVVRAPNLRIGCGKHFFTNTAKWGYYGTKNAIFQFSTLRKCRILSFISSF